MDGASIAPILEAVSSSGAQVVPSHMSKSPSAGYSGAAIAPTSAAVDGIVPEKLNVATPFL